MKDYQAPSLRRNLAGHWVRDLGHYCDLLALDDTLPPDFIMWKYELGEEGNKKKLRTVNSANINKRVKKKKKKKKGRKKIT